MELRLRGNFPNYLALDRVHQLVRGDEVAVADEGDDEDAEIDGLNRPLRPGSALVPRVMHEALDVFRESQLRRYVESLLVQDDLILAVDEDVLNLEDEQVVHFLL